MNTRRNVSVVKRADPSSSAQFLTPDLVDNLQSEVAAIKKTDRCGSIVFSVANFKADSEIGYNVNHDQCQTTASTDSDFGILCGGNRYEEVAKAYHAPFFEKDNGKLVKKREVRFARAVWLGQGVSTLLGPATTATTFVSRPLLQSKTIITCTNTRKRS